MYDIISLILILASLSVIIIIVVKKFPALAALDAENNPFEKEAKFKERIVSNRLKRNFLKWRTKITRAVGPAGAMIARLFSWALAKLHELKEKYKKEAVLGEIALSQKIEKLFEEAEEFTKKGELKKAEDRLIEIIRLDNKNIKAFKELGHVYFENKNYREAGQTFAYILKINENDSETFFDFSCLHEATGNLEAAADNLKKALNIEPNNPRFLDMMLKISIIKKDKEEAERALAKLQEANPENQKLEEFKRQIEEI